MNPFQRPNPTPRIKVLSHDVFLKQMWAKNGGNGWGFVPDVFLAYLAERGVDKTILKKLCIDNPGRLLTA